MFLALNRKGGDTKRDHFVAGRGSGKTECGIILLVDGVSANPGLQSVWTEPTYGLCRDIFLANLKRIVPSDCYTVNHSDLTVKWCNGHVTHVRSRNVDNPSKESIKGLTIAFAIEDEIAYKFDTVKYWDLDACIRDPKATGRFHACLTTPKLNQYHTLIASAPDEHRVITASSFDNPHLPDSWAANLERQMSKRRARQEIYGDWVPQGYEMWPEWSDDLWPAGNIIDYRHDFTRPYYLAFDIGSATGAYMAVQPVRDTFGRDKEPVWVVTHQWLPRREGSVDKVFPEISKALGKPIHVAVGADVNTRSSTTGDTPMFFISRHFGGVPVTAVTGWIASKEVQLAQLSYGICSSDGKRRFAVSKHLKSYPGDTDRGILQAMKQDHFPDENDAKSLRNIWDAVKGPGHETEHIRDAAMYASVAYMFPPALGYQHAIGR